MCASAAAISTSTFGSDFFAFSSFSFDVSCVSFACAAAMSASTFGDDLFAPSWSSFARTSVILALTAVMSASIRGSVRFACRASSFPRASATAASSFAAFALRSTSLSRLTSASSDLASAPKPLALGSS